MSPPQHVHPGRGGSSRPSPDLYMSRGASTCPLQQAAHCCACDLQLRKQLDLHVNLVHGFSMSGLPTRHKDVDIVVIRSALPSLHQHSLGHALFPHASRLLFATSSIPPVLTMLHEVHEAAGLSSPASQKWVDAAQDSSCISGPALARRCGAASAHQGLSPCRENTEGEYSGLEHEVVPDVIESLKVSTS